MHAAYLAGKANHYEDMASNMKTIVEMGNPLSPKERNYFTAAYKKMVDAQRDSCWINSTIEQKIDGSERSRQKAKEKRETAEGYIRVICTDVLGLIDTHLIPKATDPESKVFYFKMKGDYHRYLAEIAIGDSKKPLAIDAQNAYQQAYDIARTKIGRCFISDQLQPTHPTRLGVALHFSGLYYEILNSPYKAYQLAHDAFDDAIAELDSMNGENYGMECTLIMQLLRNNLTEWVPTIGMMPLGMDIVRNGIAAVAAGPGDDNDGGGN